MKRVLLATARGVRSTLVAIIALAGTSAILAIGANYTMTQGTGTTFGSLVVSAVNYAQMLVCDPATPSQCAAVSAGGAVKVDASATTQPVSGTVTANAGTNLNTSALGTSANQGTMISSLASIAASSATTATNSGLSIPPGTASIGAVTNVTLGTTTDTPCTLPASATACTDNALLKAAANAINSPPPLGTANGWTPLKLAALTNTAVAIKAAAGQLGKLYCYNPNATVAYIQVYNVAAGSVTVGTTVSLQSYGIPPISSAGFIMALVGDQYGTAISAAATTTAGGGTAPGTAIDCNASYN